MSETITVNGESRPWRAQTVAELLAADGLTTGTGGLAVARNASVVPRGEWETTRIDPDDRIEIVHIVRGG